MTRTNATAASRRPRYVCYHEAGHAFARWYFGHYTDRAVVLTTEQVDSKDWPVSRKGHVAEDCTGIVEGYRIQPRFSRAEMASWNVHGSFALEYGAISAEVALVELHMGPAAEARYRRTSAFVCFIAGGMSDLLAIRQITSGWFPEDEHRAESTADRRARALIRSEPAWAAISSIADRLMVEGILTGQQISDTCAEAFTGRVPRHGSWNDSWPPTLQQLRAGYIPEDEA